MATRTIIRLTSVTLALSLIIGFAITSASADLQGCRNCVESSDVKNGSLTSADIRNRTIRVADLAPQTIPRAGWTMLDRLASTGSTTGEELDSFSVTSPGTGYLYIEVTGKYWFEVDASIGDGLTKAAGHMALCTQPNVVDGRACGASSSNEEEIFFADADTVSGDNETPYFTLSRVVKVRKGTHTFYLNGKVFDLAETLNLRGPVRATAMYMPGGLRVR